MALENGPTQGARSKVTSDRAQRSTSRDDACPRPYAEDSATDAASSPATRAVEGRAPRGVTGDMANADFERLKMLVDQGYASGSARTRLRPALAGASVLGLGAVLVLGPEATELPWTLRAPEVAVVEPTAEPIPPAFEAEAEPAEPRFDTPRPQAVLPASVARAAAVVFSEGRQVGRGRHYDVRLTAEARSALRSVGIEVPRRSHSAATREAALVRGLGRLVETLGSLEGALACLRVERELVETALDLAYGSNLPRPHSMDSFGRYLPPAERERAEGPTRRVMALALGFDMQWPVPEAAKVSSPFGTRIHPVLGEPMWHTGTDLAVETGTPIRAMADGEVLYSKRDAVNGKFVKLDHGFGLTSAYVHNSRLVVKEGEWVKRGQVIALSGETGRATGPHLHFQVELDDRPIDPEAFRERKAPRAHRRSIEAEAIGDAHVPH